MPILVDDGSTDGTGEAVQQRFPRTRVIQGSGQLYWNGGMRVAMETALRDDFDYVLWLNDDVLLTPHALRNLVDTYKAVRTDGGTEAIVVGTTQDAATGDPSYGGRVSDRAFPFSHLVPVQPGPEPREAVTMNGNCALIPVPVVRLVGNLDPVFSHSMGDYDYGFRARKAGIRLFVCPGFVGTCAKNARTELPPGPRASVKAQLANVSNQRNMPYREWYVFTRRHWPFLWPIKWTRPYAAAVIRAIRWKWRGQTSRPRRGTPSHQE